ncbi:MAG: PAS domain S-box protein [Spirochaetia bacterium]|nr:PAS domain S-box protein [Spirochaetia bacterium]
MVSGFNLFFVLFNNLALFIALVAIYSYLLQRFKHARWYNRQIIFGLSFGLFAIGCMYARIPVFEGVIVDQRNAIIALSGAYGGALSALISAVLAGGFRVFLGGQGVLAGVFGIALAAAAGIVLHRYENSFSSMANAALSSLFAVLLILPGFLLVEDLETGWNLMQAMALPYGLAIFLGIFLVGLLLNREEKRYLIELSQQESEEKYRVLFESFPLGITISDRDGKTIEHNEFAGKILKFSENEGANWERVNSDCTRISPKEDAGMRALRENQKIDSEIGLKNKNGDITWLHTIATPIPLKRYGVAVIYDDITARKQANIQLNEALEEKNVLIKEIHHRVKNNLNVVVSLLNLSEEKIHSIETAREAFRQSRERIYSIALVHENLYQSEHLSEVEMEGYIQNMVWHLKTDSPMGQAEITYLLDIDKLKLDITKAVPCGIILNELIMNAQKHAFPQDITGTVTVGLKEKADHMIELFVYDDGIALAHNYSAADADSLGLTLIRILSKQIDGKFTIDTSRGKKFSILFPHN